MVTKTDPNKIVQEMQDLGMSKEGAERMNRLLMSKPTREEREKWIKCGILNEQGQILVDSDFDIEDGAGIAAELILFDLTYQDKLVRKNV